MAEGRDWRMGSLVGRALAAGVGLCSITLVAATLAAPAASATLSTLYAAATATGTGDCSSAADACSLSTALGDVGPGGTIELVTPGATAHYDGGFTVATSGTSATAPVTIEAAPGVAAPTLDGHGNGTVLTVGSGDHVGLAGVTITGGNAHFGGGIYNSGTMSVTSSTITGGNAPFGGGIENVVGGTMSVTRSTITANTATVDGGGGILNGGGTVSLEADILATPGGPPGSGECAGGGFTDSGYNVADDSTCGFTATTSVVSAAAGDLGSLANNGGPTQTVEPTAGNPAIGIIPNPTTGLCPATDQRGVASLSGVSCDAGAVQVAAQTITFKTTPPTPAAYGGSYTPAATGGGSGNPVIFSVDAASSAGACSLTNTATVELTGLGTCIVDANQAGGTDYAAATQAQQSFTITPAAQAIGFSAPAGGTVGTTTTLSATGGGSGNPVVFTVDAATTSGVCSVSGVDGTTLDYTGVGNCVIDANQAGDTDYSAAPTVTATIAVTPGSVDGPQITATQAGADATAFVSNLVAGRGYQVLSVKHTKLSSSGPKDYYQVKLQLGENGRKAATTNVWVDATSSPGTVTAASGGGLSYRDTNLVSPARAQANAVALAGGGNAYKWQLNGGKWRWYWVFVLNGATKHKIGVDAVTGIVTQIKQSEAEQNKPERS